MEIDSKEQDLHRAEVAQKALTIGFVRAEHLVGVSVRGHGGHFIEITGLGEGREFFLTVQPDRCIVIHGREPRPIPNIGDTEASVWPRRPT